MESRATLLSRDLKRNLFNLFASWGGPLTKQLVNVYHAANCVEEAKLQFGALWVSCYVFIYKEQRLMYTCYLRTSFSVFIILFVFTCVRSIEFIQMFWSLQIRKGKPQIHFRFSTFSIISIRRCRRCCVAAHALTLSTCTRMAFSTHGSTCC